MSKLARSGKCLSGGTFVDRKAARLSSGVSFVRYASDKPTEKLTDEAKTSENSTNHEEVKSSEKKKTVAELDEEIRMKMEGRSGEGGEAGLELEDGRPAAMKRSVKNNMFRLI
ncbi:MAG: hypothetical protein Q9220_002798 [cf. Caloplaca sp. 1 TL-2023]